MRFLKKMDQEVRYYTEDSFEALKRRGKLRGCDWCRLGETFPEPEGPPESSFFTSEEEAKRMREEMDERPVTPPRKGFKMTGPGQNYHNESKMPQGATPDYVSFQAQALGGGDNANLTAEEREGKDRISSCRTKQKMLDLKKYQPAQAAIISSEKQKLDEMAEQKRKSELLGRIWAHHARMGESEPFGLAAASIQTIQEHYAKCQGDLARRATAEGKQQERAARIESIAKEVQSAESSNAAARTMQFEPRALGSASESSGMDSTGTVPLSKAEHVKEPQKLQQSVSANKFYF